MRELHNPYVDVMRRIGHYRWFSLFMKHFGSRLDRALIHASRGRLSMSGPQMTTMAAHYERQKKRQRPNRSAVLRARR